MTIVRDAPIPRPVGIDPPAAPVPTSAPATATAADRATAFEALLEPLLGRAYGFAWSLTRNDADAQDLVQEAALLAFRGFDAFRPGTNFKAWFYRILKNCYLMAYRKTTRRPSTVSLDDTGDFVVLPRPGGGGLRTPGSEAAEDILSRIGVDQVTAAIADLPSEHRVVCTLFFLEELSYPEIAEVLECPIGTVRSRLHRARRTLQQALWRAAIDSGVVRDDDSNVERRRIVETMTCGEARARLDEYLDGTLAPGESARIDAHLSACPECEARFGFERRLLEHVRRQVRSVGVPEDLLARIGRLIRGEPT